MKTKLRSIFILLLAVSLASMAMTAEAQETEPETAFSGSNYLYIQEFEIATGTVINEAIAEAQEWARSYRETGEYKSVRLFLHHVGPRLALYLFLEPKSWQAIVDGEDKFFAANPELLDEPIAWGTHSDNLLTEIAAE